MASNISPLTFETAFLTDFPLYCLLPSLSSQASCLPVEAPEGTDALPVVPVSKITSVSTVG